MAVAQNVRPMMSPVLPDVVHPAVISPERVAVDRELSSADTSMDTQNRAAVNNDGGENITPTESNAETAVEDEQTDRGKE